MGMQGLPGDQVHIHLQTQYEAYAISDVKSLHDMSFCAMTWRKILFEYGLREKKGPLCLLKCSRGPWFLCNPERNATNQPLFYFRLMRSDSGAPVRVKREVIWYLYPDVVFSSHFAFSTAGVNCAGRFYEQCFTFFFGKGLMLRSFRYDIHFTRF